MSRTVQEEKWPSVRPFYKMVGGKTALLPVLRELVPDRFGRYHEPFVGGGALFWNLAEAGRLRVGGVFLSDANPVLARSFLAVKNDVEGVIRRLEAMPSPITEKHYYSVRSTTPETRAALSDAELAAWWCYVNKVGYNGMYRVNKAGGFNVPYGHWEKHGCVPCVCDAPLLRACANVLDSKRVSIEVRAFESVLKKAEKGDFVYCDPPYVPVSKTADFVGYTEGGFGYEDHVRLRDVALELKSRGVHVMLSNADVPQVRELYAPGLGFRVDEVMAPRSVNSKGDGRGVVKEVIVR